MSHRLTSLAWGLSSLLAVAGTTASVAPAAKPVVTPPSLSSSASATSPSYVDPESLDSEGALTLRPVPDPTEKLPPFLRHAEYLRSHHDDASAAEYLQAVVTNDADISSRDRARAILDLADSLQAVQRPAETLCWLKIWMGLYSGRPETAAVAYRMGRMYTQMGLPSLARDSYYLALSFAINQGQVQNPDDLQHYQRLTNGTLWALAENEYQAGQWARAAELFDRYRREAPMASPGSLVKATYLQADCYYQLRDAARATAAYTAVLEQHPFHPLAPQARLRLYHLDMLANQTAQAQGQLQALIWTVRTVWPQQEAYWQKQTAELLLALNHRSGKLLPPLLAKSGRLRGQDKAWQGELDHYDKLAKFQADTMPTIHPQASADAAMPGLREQDDLMAMQHSIADLAPPRITAPVAPVADSSNQP
jgi:tetratricopeptide (TPR) repeat protein